MPDSALARAQLALCHHLRDPEQPVPEGLETRRLGVYRELIFNNLAGFLDSGFPVLKSLLDAAQWRALARHFLADYRAQTPYFLQIGQEFLAFLQARPDLLAPLPPFALELAHYEWVELALDVAEAELPPARPLASDSRLSLSPLAWNLAYRYPVHKISPDFQPTAPGQQPTLLLVYRNRADRVKFMALSPLSSHLLQLLADEPGLELAPLLARLRAALGRPDADPAFEQQARALVRQLVDADILLPA